MRVRQQGSRTLRKTILIYCEGETERIYFEQMRILKRSKMVSVKIKNVKRSAIKLAQHAYRDSSYQYFDEVWIVFDKDDLTEKQLEEVNQFCEEKIFALPIPMKHLNCGYSCILRKSTVQKSILVLS